MKQKKTYYAIVLVAVLVLLAGYHFYAASQAEKQIKALIAEQTAPPTAPSVQYSSLNVTPFTGKIIIRDLTIVLGDHIERARQVTVDLAYLDVLKFYLGGTAYALRNLHEATAHFIQPSYVNKSSLQQLSAGNLRIYFRGQALDAIRAAVADTAFSHSQSIRMQGDSLQMEFPQTLIAGFRADSFHYNGLVQATATSFWKEGEHTFTMDSLTWTPSQDFQNTYGFFIKGFGYATDAIPFKSASMQSHPRKKMNDLHVKANLRSELMLVSAKGDVLLRQPFGTSRLRDMKLLASDFSESFSKVLRNIEKLFSIQLPRTSKGGISIPIRGTLANPVIVQ